MVIVDSFNVAFLSVLSVISIVIVGVLVSLCFSREKQRTEILHFLIVFLSATIYLLIDFFNFEKILIINLANTIFAFLIIFFLLYTVIRFRKKLDNYLLLFLLVLSVNFMIWTFLVFSYPEVYNVFFHNISKFGMHLGTYFLIIKFVIDSSLGDGNEKK